jgi:isopentenyl diphosphate isomerase/L-lactate dehydrogenase-like FMN-dependent dehydrogenase
MKGASSTDIVSVGMTVTIGVIERVIAKIGINLLAYSLGRDYVTDFGFRKVKDGILTGKPSVGGQIVEDVSMKAMLDAAPNNHHVIFLSKVSQSRGRAAIILVMPRPLFLCGGPIVCLSFSLARVRLEPGELQFPDAAGGVYCLLL